MIDVTKDPDPEPVERCFKCKERTAHWFLAKDVACCPRCALVVDADDVPNKETWCAEMMKLRKYL